MSSVGIAATSMLKISFCTSGGENFASPDPTSAFYATVLLTQVLAQQLAIPRPCGSHIPVACAAYTVVYPFHLGSICERANAPSIRYRFWIVTGVLALPIP